jgi:hypothetical protein
MDKDTIDTIIELNKEQNKQFETLLNAQDEKQCARIKGIQKNIESGFEVVKVEMNKQNGRISALEEDNKNTSWWRTFQRHPKMTLFILALFIIGGLVILGIDIETGKISQFVKELKFW